MHLILTYRCLQSCVYCKKRGATLGCVPMNCERSYHVHCAVAAGCHFDPARHVLGQGGMFCPLHTSNPKAANAVPGNGSGASWADQARQCREELKKSTAEDAAAAGSGRFGEGMDADELDAAREKLLTAAFDACNARGKRCGVCSVVFRPGLGSWPDAAAPHYVNPSATDAAGASSPPLLSAADVQSLAAFHPVLNRAAPQPKRGGRRALDDSNNDDDADAEEQLEDDDDGGRAALDEDARPLPESIADTSPRDDDGTWWMGQACLSCTDCGVLVHAGCYGASPTIVEQILVSHDPKASSSGEADGPLGWRCDACAFAATVRQKEKAAAAAAAAAGGTAIAKPSSSSAYPQCCLCPIVESPVFETAAASSSSSRRLAKAVQHPLKRCSVRVQQVSNSDGSDGSLHSIGSDRGVIADQHMDTGGGAAPPPSTMTATSSLPLPQPTKAWVHASCALWSQGHSHGHGQGHHHHHHTQHGQQHGGSNNRQSAVAVTLADQQKLSIVVTASVPADQLKRTLQSSTTASGVTAAPSSLDILRSTLAQQQPSPPVVCGVCNSSAGLLVPTAHAALASLEQRVEPTLPSQSHVHASCAIGARWHVEQYGPIPMRTPSASSLARQEASASPGRGHHHDHHHQQQLAHHGSTSFSLLQQTSSLHPPSLPVSGGIAVYPADSAPVPLFCSCREPDDGGLFVSGMRYR